jgi:hypothetical protein
VYFYVLKTVPHKTEPEVVDCFTGEESWVNLCFCAVVFVYIVGTKNEAVCCRKEKRSLHDASTFPSKYINKIAIFSK